MCLTPELDIFNSGMVNIARVLIKEGLITGPVYANVLLGSIASAQANLLHKLVKGVRDIVELTEREMMPCCKVRLVLGMDR